MNGKSQCAALGAALLSAGLATPAHGQFFWQDIVGLTVQNQLIAFESRTPGIVNMIGTISGLAAGDVLVGIDRRMTFGPKNGLLYAFGVNSADGSARIYTLNETTATATLISTLTADPADIAAPSPFMTVMGTSFGMDFTPEFDRLRVVSNTGQNLWINVDNGLVQLDPPLAFREGDPNYGETPVVGAIAYSGNYGGATLYGIEVGQDPDAFVIHVAPNDSALHTYESLPFNSSDVASFDVSGGFFWRYYAVNLPGSTATSLYTEIVGPMVFAGNIGGGVAVVGIAAPAGVQIPEPTAAILLAVGGLGIITTARRNRT